MGKFEYADNEPSALHRNGRPHSPSTPPPVCRNASAVISPAVVSSMLLYEDAVYGCIELPPDVQSIMATDHFKRLKKVYQLDFLRFIYPSANITRYQHCIGTYFAATRMLDALELNSSKAIFSQKNWPLYRLAVELAALLHDVGHGPGSHSWEIVCGKEYIHERVALDCVDLIFKELPTSDFKILRADDNFGIRLIKALIVADKQLVPDFPAEYGFIFEIVNNEQYKVDVDKWDYLQRDYKALKSHSEYPLNMDFDDVFLNARVSKDGSHIEYRYEDAKKFYQIFEARSEMWRQFYCSGKSKCRVYMFREMVGRSPNAVLNGKPLTTIRPGDREYLQLTDDVVLDLLRTDKWYKALTSDATFAEVAQGGAPENTQEVIDIEVKIPAPRSVMPPLPPHKDCVHFYGNPKNMPVFEQNDKTLIIKGRYVVPQL